MHTHRLGHVNDWDLALGLNLLLLVLGASLGGDKSPQTVDVDDRAEVHVLGLVEVTHTDLTEVTRVTAQQGKCQRRLRDINSLLQQDQHTALLSRAARRGSKYSDGWSLLFVEVNTMVMLATSVTASTRVLAVLSDTSLTVGHASTQLAALLQPCSLHRQGRIRSSDAVQVAGAGM